MMREIVVTWMDGKQEHYPLNPDDCVIARQDTLRIIRSRYPKRTDNEMNKNIPLNNVRIWNEYE